MGRRVARAQAALLNEMFAPILPRRATTGA
jgi:hypothetical protein